MQNKEFPILKYFLSTRDKNHTKLLSEKENVDAGKGENEKCVPTHESRVFGINWREFFIFVQFVGNKIALMA